MFDIKSFVRSHLKDMIVIGLLPDTSDPVCSYPYPLPEDYSSLIWVVGDTSSGCYKYVLHCVYMENGRSPIRYSVAELKRRYFSVERFIVDDYGLERWVTIDSGRCKDNL